MSTAGRCTPVALGLIILWLFDVGRGWNQLTFGRYEPTDRTAFLVYVGYVLLAPVSSWICGRQLRRIAENSHGDSQAQALRPRALTKGGN